MTWLTLVCDLQTWERAQQREGMVLPERWQLAIKANQQTSTLDPHGVPLTRERVPLCSQGPFTEIFLEDSLEFYGVSKSPLTMGQAAGFT